VLHLDVAVDQVVEGGDALGGDLQADRVGQVGLVGAIPAGAGVAVLPLLLLRPLPIGLDLLGGAIAAVGLALGEEAVDVAAVDVAALRLEVGRVWTADLGALVPVEAEPTQAVEDGGGVLLGAPL